MPAPITDDWQAVQDTAVACGSISQAADQHGVTRDAAFQRAKRENWPVGRRPAKALAAAREAHAAQIVKSGGVKSVSTTQAVTDINADYSRRGRTAALRYGAEKLEYAANLDDETGLARAAEVKAVVGTMAVAGDWNAAQQAVRVNIFTAGGAVEIEKPVVDI